MVQGARLHAGTNSGKRDTGAVNPFPTGGRSACWLLQSNGRHRQNACSVSGCAGGSSLCATGFPSDVWPLCACAAVYWQPGLPFTVRRGSPSVVAHGMCTLLAA